MARCCSSFARWITAWIVAVTPAAVAVLGLAEGEASAPPVAGRVDAVPLVGDGATVVGDAVGTLDGAGLVGIAATVGVLAMVGVAATCVGTAIVAALWPVVHAASSNTIPRRSG